MKNFLTGALFLFFQFSALSSSIPKDILNEIKLLKMTQNGVVYKINSENCVSCASAEFNFVLTAITEYKIQIYLIHKNKSEEALDWLLQKALPSISVHLYSVYNTIPNK